MADGKLFVPSRAAWGELWATVRDLRLRKRTTPQTLDTGRRSPATRRAFELDANLTLGGTAAATLLKWDAGSSDYVLTSPAEEVTVSDILGHYWGLTGERGVVEAIQADNGVVWRVVQNPGQCCEGSLPPVPCFDCLDEIAPAFVDITIAGITNGRCPNSTCETFNGTFRQQSLVECNWNKRYFGCSEGLPFDINFGFDGFGQLFGALGLPGEGAIYECFDPDETDCLNWLDLVMTKTSETIPPDPFCLNYPATFTVSAV